MPRGTASEFVAGRSPDELLIIPGKIFSRRDTHFRISYAANDETIDRGSRSCAGWRDRSRVADELPTHQTVVDQMSARCVQPHDLALPSQQKNEPGASRCRPPGSF